MERGDEGSPQARLVHLLVKMEKKLRNEAIDIVKQLLDYAKNLPIFTVEFDIAADNKSCEEHITANADRIDWSGNRLTDEEVQSNVQNALKRFHESDGYNPVGISTLTMRKTFTLQSISVNTVYETISGNCKDMPKGYTFVGEMRLVNGK